MKATIEMINMDNIGLKNVIDIKVNRNEIEFTYYENYDEEEQGVKTTKSIHREEILCFKIDIH